MQLRMWMLDIAREQSPTLDHLRRYLDLTREAGYNAIGLYFEHRFAYGSTPWSHGKGCVTPEMIRTLVAEYPDIQIVPFLNLLGHLEGMIYTEEGKRYRESLFEGMQACPSCPEFMELCHSIIDEAIALFSSPLIHIGGDETWQLGQCLKCKARLGDVGEAAGSAEPKKGASPELKAHIYGSHFGPLAERVAKAGRRPGVWGDMFLEHPEALECLPKNTLIFDWQYFKGVRETVPTFLDRGFEVVGCPALHTYDAAWMHLPQSEKNVREVIQDAIDMGLYGVCVTTWECGLFGSYDTLFPALQASGAMLRRADDGDARSEEQDSAFLRAYLQVSERHEEWARLMGVELNELGGVFVFDGWRSRLKSRLLMYSNPFLLWMRHGEELSGEIGSKALSILERAEAVAPGEAEKGVTLFVRGAVQFAQTAEKARTAYAAKKPGEALASLTICRGIFEDLERIAKKTHARIGGSLADIERCRNAKAHVETVMKRVKDYGDGSLGYLPAFEILAHPMFVPHDQACWWLVNCWGKE
ncbi:MAG: family 20 glycosylhydrolase [Armatimonadetes bacterium]|nr:family 20 glycosylhydrolase [Armatimonadota bacterium]